MLECGQQEMSRTLSAAKSEIAKILSWLDPSLTKFQDKVANYKLADLQFWIFRLKLTPLHYLPFWPSENSFQDFSWEVILKEKMKISELRLEVTKVQWLGGAVKTFYNS